MMKPRRADAARARDAPSPSPESENKLVYCTLHQFVR
jgi:hypothetical protein